MLKIFYPKEFYKRVEDINLNLDKYISYEGIILDLDNTLIKRGDTFIEEETFNWLKRAKESFKIGVISNNRKKREIEKIKELNIPIIFNGLKPLPFSFYKMLKILNLKRDKIILIGDQIFTDILGGNVLGFYTILVEPKDKNRDFILTKFQRFFEKSILKKIKNCVML
ncbi:MAG: YqeG family HAD IIIA-type phosphatase [Caldisericia bacterium]|nr:YqeG family HAD IIIA-type phosphatase [Caldisericia bacterium]